MNENSDRANREGYRERKKDQDAIYHSLITNSQPITAERLTTYCLVLASQSCSKSCCERSTLVITDNPLFIHNCFNIFSTKVPISISDAAWSLWICSVSDSWNVLWPTARVRFPQSVSPSSLLWPESRSTSIRCTKWWVKLLRLLSKPRWGERFHSIDLVITLIERLRRKSMQSLWLSWQLAVFTFYLDLKLKNGSNSLRILQADVNAIWPLLYLIANWLNSLSNTSEKWWENNSIYSLSTAVWYPAAWWLANQ